MRLRSLSLLASIGLSLVAFKARGQQIIRTPPTVHQRLEDSDPIDDEEDDLQHQTITSDSVAAPNNVPVSSADPNLAFHVATAPPPSSAKSSLEAEADQLTINGDHLHATGYFRTSMEGTPAVSGTTLGSRSDREKHLRSIGRAFIEQHGAAALGPDPGIEYRAKDTDASDPIGTIIYARSVDGILCPEARVTITAGRDGAVTSVSGQILAVAQIRQAIKDRTVDQAQADALVRASLTADQLTLLNLPDPTAPVGQSILVCRNVQPYLLWEIDAGSVGTFYVDAVTGVLRGHR